MKVELTYIGTADIRRCETCEEDCVYFENIHVAVSKFTKVTKLAPPEPPMGAVVQVAGRLYQRLWVKGGDFWVTPGETTRYTWNNISDIGDTKIIAGADEA